VLLRDALHNLFDLADKRLQVKRIPKDRHNVVLGVEVT
jgi:hypothetical protein